MSGRLTGNRPLCAVLKVVQVVFEQEDEVPATEFRGRQQRFDSEDRAVRVGVTPEAEVRRGFPTQQALTHSHQLAILALMHRMASPAGRYTPVVEGKGRAADARQGQGEEDGESAHRRFPGRVGVMRSL